MSRHRLWSLRDNPFALYLTRFERSHARRLETIDTFLVDGI